MTEAQLACHFLLSRCAFAERSQDLVKLYCCIFALRLGFILFSLRRKSIVKFNPRQGPVAEVWVKVAPPRIQECAQRLLVLGCTGAPREGGSGVGHRQMEQHTQPLTPTLRMCYSARSLHTQTHAHTSTRVSKTPPHRPMQRHPYTRIRCTRILGKIKPTCLRRHVGHTDLIANRHL